MSLEARSSVRSVFLLSLAIYFCPLLFFPHIPTQDGPLHVDTSAVMRESLGAASGYLHQFFDIRFAFETNTLGHDILLLCLKIVGPAEHAEKLFQLVYLTLFAGGAAYFLSGVQAGAWQLVPLLLPFAYSYIFHMGFYNDCLSLCGFLWCWGALLRYDAKPSGRNFLILCCLTFLTWLAHPVGTVAFAVGAVFWGALELLVVRKTPFSARLRRMLLPQLAVCCLLIMEALFLRESSSRRGWTFQSFPELTSRLVHLSTMDSFELAGFSTAMTFVSSAAAALFIFGLFNAVRVWRREKNTTALVMLLMAIFYLAVYFLAPWDAAGSGYINERLMPYIFVFLTALLAITNILRKPLAVAGITAVAALHIVHWPVYSQEVKVERDYLFAASELPPRSIVYPMHLASHGWDGTSYASHRTDFTNHLAGFYTANTKGIYLNNTIARWREGRQISFLPNVAQGLELLPAAFPKDPVELDFELFAKAVGKPVDYVLLYGNFSDNTSSARYYEKRLEKSFDCSLVSPLGLVKLCKKR